MKSNGRILERSTMMMVLEVELMRGAVNAEIGVWESLREQAGLLGLDPAMFDALIENSRKQVEMLEEIF